MGLPLKPRVPRERFIGWWQGELDRRDARIAELEQWQAEAVEFIKTVECQAAYCSAESDTFPSFADAPLCPSCTTQRRGVSSDE